MWHTVELSGTIWNTVELTGTMSKSVELTGTKWNSGKLTGTMWNTVQLTETHSQPTAKHGLFVKSKNKSMKSYYWDFSEAKDQSGFGSLQWLLRTDNEIVSIRSKPPENWPPIHIQFTMYNLVIFSHGNTTHCGSNLITVPLGAPGGAYRGFTPVQCSRPIITIFRCVYCVLGRHHQIDNCRVQLQLVYISWYMVL